MSSRDEILRNIRSNQPSQHDLPNYKGKHSQAASLTDSFQSVVTSIGGTVRQIHSVDEIEVYLHSSHEGKRWVAVSDRFSFAEVISQPTDPHTLENVEVAVIEGLWGVAENGSVWVTEKELGVRALPFICQHLIICIPRDRVVATMHEAYEKLDGTTYHFGTFIAGPSKTADIEQSLVLGAHGARTLTVFIVA